MSVNVCPLATIHAPVEHVWRFLSEPTNYSLWWDAQTRSIVPEGPVSRGQKIYAQTAALGKRWDVNVTVEEVDEPQRRIHLTTMLPWGITVHNEISCIAVNHANCRVSFG